MRMMKNIFILLLILLFIGCNSPSESIGTIVQKSDIYNIDNYCYDVDLNDSIIVLAASDGGYYKFSYELDSDAFPVLSLINSEDNYNAQYENESIDKVILSSDSNGIIYMLDRYTGGSSGIWLDNSEGVEMDPYLDPPKRLQFTIQLNGSIFISGEMDPFFYPVK